MKSIHAFVFILLSGVCFSQQVFRGLNAAVTVSGSGTRGTWSMSSQEGTVTAEATFNKNLDPSAFHNVSFSVPAERLKSENITLTSNARYSLNAKKFKTITFVSRACTVKDNNVSCPGRVTAAGTSVMITLHAFVRQLGPIMQLTGTQTLKLSDFLGKTPSYIFNSVIPNDEVEVSFDAMLEEKKAVAK